MILNSCVNSQALLRFKGSNNQTQQRCRIMLQFRGPNQTSMKSLFRINSLICVLYAHKSGCLQHCASKKFLLRKRDLVFRSQTTFNKILKALQAFTNDLCYLLSTSILPQECLEIGRCFDAQRLLNKILPCKFTSLQNHIWGERLTSTDQILVNDSISLLHFKTSFVRYRSANSRQNIC